MGKAAAQLSKYLECSSFSISNNGI